MYIFFSNYLRSHKLKNFESIVETVPRVSGIKKQSDIFNCLGMVFTLNIAN